MNLSAYPELFSLGIWLLAAFCSAVFITELWRLGKIEANAPDAARYDDLEHRLVEKETEIIDAKKILSERDFAREQIKEANETLDNLKNEIDNLGENREEVERLREDLEKLAEELNHKKLEKLRLADECEEGLREKNRLEDDCETLKEATKELEKERKSTEKEATKIDQKLVESEAKLKEQEDGIAAIQSELSKLESRQANESEKLATRLRELDQLAQQLQTRQLKVNSLEGRQQELERRLSEISDALENETKSAKTRATDHQKAMTQYAQVQSDLKQAKSEVITKENELKQLNAEIKAHEALKENLPDIAEGLQGLIKGTGKYAEKAGGLRYKDLWEPYVKGRNESDTTTSEKEKFEAMQRFIEKQGLVFPQRVLSAFHTALKVNDISPIVVLAGLSGTGKSELPRRYAEGMGMHFVNLAVQPRWEG
jgi:chromosome segregation ATPase